MSRCDFAIMVLCLACAPLRCAVAQETITDSPVPIPVVELQFFDGNGCHPGELNVRFRDGSTADDQKRFIASMGLKPANILTVHQTTGSGTQQITRYSEQVFEVPVGTEEFWRDVLRQFPIVQGVKFVPFLTASVDYFITRNLNKHFPFVSATGSGVKDGVALHDLLLISLRQRYAAKDVRVEVVKDDNNLLQIKVTGLHGELISASDYWEMLDPLTLVFFVAGDTVKIEAVMDARYAQTMGKKPPAEAGFAALDRDHYKETQAYLQALTTFLMDQLHSKGITQ